MTTKIIVNTNRKYIGSMSVPGDKSISHRAIILGAISLGLTTISNFLMGDDCLSTIDCLRKMGVKIDICNNIVKVYGNGINGLKKPVDILDVGNSGTTLRLLTGLLAAQSFDCEITGDSSIKKRPVKRVTHPLSLMGANIKGDSAPLKIHGTTLNSIEYTLPVASAQVKSAIILASLYADGETKITEPLYTRNHTELMINYFGGNIKRDGKTITVKKSSLVGKDVFVPSDISSAAFFMVAAAITKGSNLTIKNVGINETRNGVLSILKNMGTNIKVLNETVKSGEKTADINVSYSNDLTAVEISGEIIPNIIDEIPALAVCALFANGRTVIKNAEELKVKESNRINAIVTELKKMGAHIEETSDGMIIDGKQPLKGAALSSHGDHRIAMSLAVAALKAVGDTEISDSECVNISFPNFFELLLN